jgi:hypothetical protein
VGIVTKNPFTWAVAPGFNKHGFPRWETNRRTAIVLLATWIIGTLIGLAIGGLT